MKTMTTGLRLIRRRMLICLVLVPVLATASYPEYRVPDNIVARRVTVMSEGIPLVAHVLQAKENAGKRLATIVLCQGTGGLQHYHLHNAFAFANAGYTVITFDYRGWGQSAGRLIPADLKAAQFRQDGLPYTAEVIEVRETVDPFEQAADAAAVVAWAVAEPQVDADRLGIWGTSFGGGIALYTAINDPRIKAFVGQVGSYEARRTGNAVLDLRRDATRRTHGELSYPPPKVRVPGALHGYMIQEKYQLWSPAEDLGRLLVRPPRLAVLLVDAEKEELMDLRWNGQRVFERHIGAKERVVIPDITHYSVYSGATLQQVTKLALAWYEKYLK